MPGWVPLAILQRGEPRSLQLPIEVPANDQPFQSTTSQNNEGQPAGTVLQETLRELWRMIPAERDTITQVISGLPEQSRAVFFHRHAERYADVVHECMYYCLQYVFDTY